MRRPLMRRGVAALAWVVVGAGGSGAQRLAAQDWQSLEVHRDARDTLPVHVRLGFGTGTLRVQPAAPPTLYDLRLRYDADRLSPTVEWRPDSRTLRVQTRLDALRLGAADRADLTLALSRRSVLDFDVQVGAVEAELDFTGLRVRSLDFASGASDATVRFDTAGTTPLERLSLQVGAGSLRVLGLGQA
nr:hypothetical protein [Gemmatimonadaceae bacterium]